MGCAESCEADHPATTTTKEQQRAARRRYTVTPEPDDDEGYSIGTVSGTQDPPRHALTPDEAAVGVVDLHPARPAAPCLRKQGSSRTLEHATGFGAAHPAGDDILPPPASRRTSDHESTTMTRSDPPTEAAVGGTGSRSSSGPRVRFEQLGEDHGACPAAAGLPPLPSDGSAEGSRRSATGPVPPVMFAWDIPSASGSESSSKHGGAIDSSVDGLKVSTSTGRRRRQRGAAVHLPTADGSSPSPLDTPLSSICHVPATDNLQRLLQRQQ